MSFADPSSSQFPPSRLDSYQNLNTSTPPPPPPKPSSGRGTPARGPPLPPPPPGQDAATFQNAMNTQANPNNPPRNQVPLPDVGWLPSLVHELSVNDLKNLVEDTNLQAALLNDPANTHPAIPESQQPLRQLLESNVALSSSLQQLESRLSHQRAAAQSRLLSLRALEQQHKSKIVETEDTLRNFSPMALYQQLSASVQEQDALVKGIEESFLDEGGLAPDRETQDFIRRVRDAKRIAFLRNERKERWDEGRVGGWR